MSQCFKWNDADFSWSDACYTWNDVCIAIEIASNAEISNDWIGSVEKLEKVDKRRFIKLVCAVKREHGIEDVSTHKKYINGDKIKITADDIKLTVDQILSVSVVNKAKLNV